MFVITIDIKNRSFSQEILVQKLEFCSKVENSIKNQNFGQKWKFWSKNWNFDQKRKFRQK